MNAVVNGQGSTPVSTPTDNEVRDNQVGTVASRAGSGCVIGLAPRPADRTMVGLQNSRSLRLMENPAQENGILSQPGLSLVSGSARGERALWRAR